MTQPARSDAKSVLNHAFLLAAGLVVLVFGGVWVGRRRGASPSPSGASPKGANQS